MTVQGSALSPGVFGPSRIHLPSKRRCPKDLYKFACRIPAEVLTTVDAGGWPVASVDAPFPDTFSFLNAPLSPNFVLSIARSRFLLRRNSRRLGTNRSFFPIFSFFFFSLLDAVNGAH